MSERRWFGREPALVLQTIAALLTMIVSFGFPRLDDNVAAAIMAVLTAGAATWTALHVRPIAPSVFGALLLAAWPLLATLGLHLSQQFTGSFTILVAALVALLTRPQQTFIDPVPEAVAAAQHR